MAGEDVGTNGVLLQELQEQTADKEKGLGKWNTDKWTIQCKCVLQTVRTKFSILL